MSEIHEVNNSILSVFAAPARDISIDSYSFVEILEKSNTNQLAANLPYYEIILNDRNSWLNLSDAYLEVRARLQTVNGDQIISGNVAPISDAQNFFRRAEMWVENKSTQTVEYPGVVDQVLDLIKTSPDYEKSGSAELFYPDRGTGGINIIDGVLSATAAGAATTISGTAASPHVLGVGVGVDNAPIVLFVGTERLYPRVSTGVRAGVNVNLFKHGANAGDPIDNNGGNQFIAADVLYLYDQYDRRVFIKTPTGNLVTQLVADGNIDLTIDDGNATALAAGTISGFNPSRYNYPGFDGTDNYAFTARKSKFLESSGRYSTVSSVFYIPVRKIFSFWDYNRHVWKGAIIRMRFDRDTNYEYIFRSNSILSIGGAPPAVIAAADVNCRAVIDYMSLWLPIVKPNPLIDAKLNKAIADNASTLASWYDNEFFENNIISDNNTSEQIWKVTSKTERVVRVFMWFQNPTARTSQLVNKGVYGGYDIASAQCSINGVIYPRTKYDLQPNVNYNYTRLYNEFLRAGGHVATPSTGAALSIEEWFNLYQIVCFDLTYQPDSDKVYTGRISPSDIELRVRMNTAPGATYRMYAIVQTERYAKAQAQSDMIKLL